MFREILYIHSAEVAQSGVQGYEGRIYALDLHALQEVLREVHTCGGGCNSALMLGVDGLITLGILLFHLLSHPAGQRCLAQAVKRLLELFVGAVKEKTQGAAARCGVVDNLGTHHIVVTEIELVADTDFTCRVYQHIPKAQLAVKLAQKENLNLGTCLLFVAIEACGKDFGVVEDKEIFLIKIFDDILKDSMLDGSRFAVYHHQTRLVAVFHRVVGKHVGRKIVPVLR